MSPRNPSSILYDSTGTEFGTPTNPINVIFPSDQILTIVDSSAALKTYSACYTATVNRTATDLFTITGATNKIIKIKTIRITASATTGIFFTFYILKRSSANINGTAATITATAFSSTSSAFTGTVRSYTVNPTTLGTLVGNIWVQRSWIPKDGNYNDPLVLDKVFFNPVELRSASEVFSVNLNGVNPGATIAITCEFTEEDA